MHRVAAERYRKPFPKDAKIETAKKKKNILKTGANKSFSAQQMRNKKVQKQFNMIIKIKNWASLLLITIFFTCVSCEKDLYQEVIKTQSRGTSLKISIDQVLHEIDNSQIKNYLNIELKQELSFSKFKKKSEDYSNFMKIIKENEYVTYSLLINDYSKDKPFFKYLIITKNKATEKAGFAKFIPNSPVAFFDEKHFSGTLQVFDLKNNIKGETQFINGVAQVKNTKSKIASKSESCTNTYSIITHNCTNGGSHSPGTSCNNDAINDGYYEIVVSVTCSGSTTQYIAEPDRFMAMSSTGGGGNSLSFNENVLQFLYSLSEEEYAVVVANLTIVAYLEENDASSASKEFSMKLIYSQLNNPNQNFNDVFYNKTSLDTNSSLDLDNNTDGGNDTNTYSDFNPQQTWTTIFQVIPTSQFVGWGSPGIKRNCMDYAKAQIAKNGYQISNYGSAGQTFQIYTEQNGVNEANLTKGLSYLKYALSNNISVIVGVDENPGHPGNPDNSTDHFVVIVGMGSNSNGNYFQFYDNASGNTSQGTSPLNLLYYNSSTGKISGKSQCSGYFNSVAHDYIITQIRKSKTKL
ncbi:hypothetical protein [Flavobacterium sp. GSP6]|uniref:hypothetical protein n=1 Tax=Flavobacterium sp. GSP6 TaxID=2497488 RepID=UPI000F8931EF|nr:hypothetical protein [Flavobacterium sp. GSP6]RTZ01766.1 hypothetical protein EKM03_14785 [Flavobacterium sp. GSP6]